MSSQFLSADQTVNRRRQRQTRSGAKSAAISLLAGSVLSLGFLSSLQAGMVSQADAGKQRLAPVHRTDGQAHTQASGLEALRPSHGQKAAEDAHNALSFLAASIIASDFFPPSKAEAANSKEAAVVGDRIAPVARLEVQGAEPPAAKPAEPGADAVAAPSSKAAETEARTLIESWAHAWSERDVDQYLGAYGKGFTPDKGLARGEWEQSRRQKIESRKSISVAVRDLKIEADGENRLTARFLQDYSADSFHETGTLKSLVLAHEDGGWRIVAETSGNLPAK